MPQSWRAIAMRCIATWLLGGRTKEEFVELMANLKLQPPKKLAISLPANLRDGAPARMAA